MDNLPNVNLPNPPIPVPQPPSNPMIKWWIIGGILLIGIIILAFYIFRSTLFPSTPKITQKQNPNPTPISQRANPLFETQSATIQGIITKINGSTLSITNDKGISGDFPISSKVLIYNYGDTNQKNQEGLPIASASSDLKTVKIGKKSTLFLELINGEYQVTYIYYLPVQHTPASTR